jgi:uncharacterized protein YxjI
MRYKMKQKFWAMGNDFHILDHQDQNVYLVDGAAFSWGQKLSFQDMTGKELAHISQKMMSFMPRYEIYRQGAKFADVKQNRAWFKTKFTLDVPGPNDYTINGSFFQHEFTFERGGQTVATVSKKNWEWIDHYGIDIIDGEDDICILATCVVIDLVCHGDDSRF